MTGAPRIAVVGSINVDVVTRATRLPKAGETIRGTSFALTLGGKGANQAIAATKLGANVTFIGRIGSDVFGDYARRELTGAGLDLTHVAADSRASTGTATISIDSLGQNAITIVAGANDALTPADVERAGAELQRADILLLQCEVPAETNLAAARIVKAARGLVILDPAPVPEAGIARELSELVDFITPNESESAALTGLAAPSRATAPDVANALKAMGFAGIALKLGGNGAFLSAPTYSGHSPAFSVTVVDTVAAGDSFNAGLAYALGQRIAVSDAIRFAQACGALATTRHGASSAAPRLDDVKKLLNQA